MATQTLQVPVVYQDLRKAEAFCQIVDALDTLDTVFNTVFTRITDKVNKEKAKLDSINSRIGTAQAKVNHLASFVSKATVVLSPAKYPAPSNLESYAPAFVESANGKPKHSKYSLAEHSHVADINVRDPLMDASVLSETQSGYSERNITFQEWEGLGRLPENLHSISGLLLFNTSENPYKVYLSLDNLAGSDVVVDRTEDVKSLAEAPRTVTEGEKLPSLAHIEYGYRPILGAVPEFNLPDALPNLAMVADISWSSLVPELPSIAPSHEANLPALPTFDPASELPPIAPTTNVASAPPPPAPPTTGSAPPPPPPPSVPTVATSAPPAPPAPPPPPSSGGAPAPPPPPPPPGAGAGAPPPPPPPSAVPSEVAQPTNSRSSLLDDIRKGHMGRLKSAKRERKAKPPKEGGDGAEAKKKAAPAASSGDIFSDLIMALNRRRVGINPTAKKSKEESEDKKTEWDD